MIYKGESLEFEIEKKIGGGGNGTVYKIACVPQKVEELAVKILNPSYKGKSYPKKKYDRFKTEVNVSMELAKISNRFIPIRDFFLPDSPNKEKKPWFVMPYAQPLKSKLFNNELTVIEKMNIILEIGFAIKDLHDNEYVHRDIKLDNILFYNGKVVLCDFGLVRHPSLERLTGDTERVGPWNTIAPEMKRVAAKFSIPKQADIYSFGKLIWIILTEDEHCFDGQYSKDDVMSLDNYFEYRTLRILHNLLSDMTRTDYNKRPNINEALFMIKDWLKVMSDETLIKNEKKLAIYEDIKSNYPPSELVYTDIEGIYAIFERLVETHSFYSKQIGHLIRVISVQKSRIVGCLEIHTENARYIFKPLKLYLIIDKNEWLIDIETVAETELQKIGINSIRKDQETFLDELFRKTLGNDLHSNEKILKTEKRVKLMDYNGNNSTF
ncbi:protein kinase domain-containing protein [Bacillus cereus]|uniref:protein kinase domain-containing protein n=1 Tax=Bacillus cereus group TaxID=86661 RepID=UPI001B8D136B|nr:protein kinase [Bacillus cereus]QUW39129.1 protein kinase [Bacillus cereus]